MDNRFDAVIIGAGMAGASAAYFLAEHKRVLLLERESQPGYHSTGRSAALYAESYGNRVIRALTTGGRRFFTAPPPGFADHAMLSPRGALYIGRADQADRLADIAVEAARLVDGIRELDRDGVRAIIPVLRPNYVSGGVLEPGAMDIDVHALHQGFLSGARERGAELRVNAAVEGLSRAGELWRLETRGGAVAAGIVVNAAGAWCDEIGALAGAAAIGLVPKRRTAIHFRPPDGLDCGSWPLCVDADEEFYFKPDAGKLIGSPADETPVPPMDVQPEEIDIAIAADRITTAADLPIDRIEYKWAGLRSFVADKSPVVGYDPSLPGFFWLAGQGGYGIQTAPSMGRLAAALVMGGEIPGDLQDLGVQASDLSPARRNLH